MSATRQGVCAQTAKFLQSGDGDYESIPDVFACAIAYIPKPSGAPAIVTDEYVPCGFGAAWKNPITE